MNESFYVDIIKHVKVIYKDGEIFNLYDDEKVVYSKIECISSIYGLMQVPERLSEKIVTQLIKTKKAIKISNFKAELTKIFMKLKSEGLPYNRLMDKFYEESLKIEKREQLVEEAKHFMEKKKNKLGVSRPITKEKISQILKELEKLE